MEQHINNIFMDLTSKIYIPGHRGLVGAAIIRKLEAKGYLNLIFRESDQLDLRRQSDVENFFLSEKPEYIFLAAARVGGIIANSTYKAEFIYDNLMIATNVIHAAYLGRAKKLLNLGSSCIYPKFAPQPMKEDSFLTGTLEPTNEPYAIAKIAAIKLCRYYNDQYGTDFISVMPTNQYGPGDNFDLLNSHVLPALIRKFHEAKIDGANSVVIWGTGEPFREFMYVDDLADACVFLMEKYNSQEIGEFINIGTGVDIKIKDLAVLVKNIVGFSGEIIFDKTKPDGTPKKLLDISRIKSLGWSPSVNLEEGIRREYGWYLKNKS